MRPLLGLTRKTRKRLKRKNGSTVCETHRTMFRTLTDLQPGTIIPPCDNAECRFSMSGKCHI